MVKSSRVRGKQPTTPRPGHAKSSSTGKSSNPASAIPPSVVRSPFPEPPPTPRDGPERGFWTGVTRADPSLPKVASKDRNDHIDSITIDDNPNLAIATPGSGASRRPDLVFYSGGERSSDDVARSFPPEYIDLIFASMYKFCPSLVPTTYEAAAEYLREEKLKPKGKRDLRREFCYLSFTKIQPSEGKPTLFLSETQTLIAVAPGHSLALPTIDCPPWALDRQRNTEPTILLFDPATRDPLDATAVMTYFTNTDPNQKHAFNESETNIIQYKGKMYE